MSSIEFALSCYQQIMRTPFDKIHLVGDTILVPKFELSVMSEIIESAQKVLEKEDVIAHLFGNIYVIGDIHGNFHDLIRIFAKNGYPPMTQYIFLGDYVDRGSMSVEVITLLLLLKISFPEHITLLRGNHEFSSVNKHYGFYQSVIDDYNDEKLWEKFNQAFEYLPLMAIINNAYLCVHGGISKQMSGLHEIEKMHFPISENELVSDLVWSDPSNDVNTFTPNCRGKGSFYGTCAVLNFMNDLGMKMIIRSHECVNGFKYTLSNLVLTVFSSSNYTNCHNKAGYAFINENQKIECHILGVFESVNKKSVCYYDAIPGSKIEHNLNLKSNSIIHMHNLISRGHSSARLLPKFLPKVPSAHPVQLRICQSHYSLD